MLIFTVSSCYCNIFVQPCADFPSKSTKIVKKRAFVEKNMLNIAIMEERVKNSMEVWLYVERASLVKVRVLRADRERDYGNTDFDAINWLTLESHRKSDRFVESLSFFQLDDPG